MNVAFVPASHHIILTLTVITLPHAQYIYSVVPLKRSQFSHKYSQNTPRSSSVRVSYGLCFVDPASDWYSVSVHVIIYVLSYDILPCYNGTTTLYMARNCHAISRNRSNYKWLISYSNFIIYLLWYGHCFMVWDNNTFLLSKGNKMKRHFYYVSELIVKLCFCTFNKSCLKHYMRPVTDESTLQVTRNLDYRKRTSKKCENRISIKNSMMGLRNMKMEFPLRF